ncbi:MAG: MerR family transcriptional regulator [Brachybacterium tyrofermentans]|uniref:MerR family transcriptional regulator n=1 Tax=Brachybacterium tyrofermentans TaxID=47848 RepID=UPI001D01F0C7|nr:MerR family transcriptional regulator [Brachybacterium tyrofermentans]
MSISDTHVRARPSGHPGRADLPGLLSIGGLAKLTRVSPRSLRYYEEQGLLVARRTEAGHRRYESEAVDRVLLVQRLFAAGLSSADIRPVLPGMIDDAHCTEDLVTELREHRDRLQQEVERQLDTIDILDEVIEEHSAHAG